MKEYVLMVRVPTSYSTEDAKAVNPAWDKVVAQWKADSIFVTSFIIPSESYVVAGAERTVRKETVTSDDLKMVSTIILNAASFEEAIELAKASPILDHGGTVEIREARPRSVPAPAAKN